MGWRFLRHIRSCKNKNAKYSISVAKRVFAGTYGGPGVVVTIGIANRDDQPVGIVNEGLDLRIGAVLGDQLKKV